MGVYMRGAIAWIAYAGPGGRSVRESTGQPDARVAERMLRDRKREVALGTWQPTPQREKVDLKRYAERWIARRKESGVRTAHDEEVRLTTYVLPRLGALPLDGIRRGDVVRMVEEVSRLTSDATGKPLAPRTVHHVYGALRACLADAVADELILASPCTLRVRRGELPAKRDADPAWRATAIFTREEVEKILSAPPELVPRDRRMLYAIELLAGLRFGEAAGRRWRDYDPSMKPLGALHCATQYVDQPLKTERPRSIPVHPLLARILAEWKLSGFVAMMGRKPTPDDWIVPSREGACRSVRHGHRKMNADLVRLGLRERRQHDSRRTLISLARSDGAIDAVLRTITHGASGTDIIDDYSTFPWPALCEAISCMRIGLRGRRTSQLTSQRKRRSAETAVSKAWNERGGRDLKAQQIADVVEIRGFREQAR